MRLISEEPYELILKRGILLIIWMEMQNDTKTVLLISMPFAAIEIPSIPLAVLEGYLKQRGISIKTRHLYLKAAEIYGVYNYNSLVYPPNDSYIAQMVFSKYIFWDHWNAEKDRFRSYYDEMKLRNKNIQEDFSFDKYVQCSDLFFDWIYNNVDWSSYDVIGFTLNYGQFLPSLAIARKIKELSPEKTIVFGGSRVVGDLGVRVLETFDYIDFVVSGDGEEALYRLTATNLDYQSIPGLIYRHKNKVIWNKSESNIDLNSLPIPSYDSFYEDLAKVSVEVNYDFSLFGRLPIEISRGCWWNKCTFCNLNIQHHQYREKDVDRIFKEIEFLSNRYKILQFQIIGNTLPKENYRSLLKKIKQLQRDFTFYAEARADQLTSEDYTLLKEAGFTMIQTGIESFSSQYLRKMNKGTRVIDNIAALKFCKENGILNRYNLIINYPNEDSIDFEETKQTIDKIKSYLDPPQLCQLRVFYGSPIHQHPDQFNIDRFEETEIDKIMFPPDVLKKGINFVYNFTKKVDMGENVWTEPTTKWILERKQRSERGIQSKNPIDEYVFYFVDGRNFLHIYDNRDITTPRFHILDEKKRVIFLSCINVISFQQLREKHPDIAEHDLSEILDTFEQHDLILKENNTYLTLPLSYKTIKRSLPIKESEDVLTTPA